MDIGHHSEFDMRAAMIVFGRPLLVPVARSAVKSEAGKPDSF